MKLFFQLGKIAILLTLQTSFSAAYISNKDVFLPINKSITRTPPLVSPDKKLLILLYTY